MADAKSDGKQKLYDQCLMIAGFKQTGKDYLCSNIQMGAVTHPAYVAKKEILGYRVYRAPKGRGWTTIKLHPDAMRIGFADPLKRSVLQQIRKTYPDATLPVLEKYKETPIQDIPPESIGNIKPNCKPITDAYRTLLIVEAAANRAQDSKCYARAAFVDFVEAVQCVKTLSAIIADYRYPIDELPYMTQHFTDMVTIRVHRVVVPVPPLSITSEHGLKDDLTEFLFTDDFAVAVKLWPQYKDYVLDL